MKAKQIIVLFCFTLGILVENVNTSPISEDNFHSMVIKIDVFLHKLRTPNEASFHRNSKLLCLGRQFGQIDLGAFGGIFTLFFSTHFGTLSPLSIFSISQPLFLQKTLDLYPNPKYFFGIGI